MPANTQSGNESNEEEDEDGVGNIEIDAAAVLLEDYDNAGGLREGISEKDMKLALEQQKAHLNLRLKHMETANEHNFTK